MVQSYSSEAYLRVRGRASVLGRAGHAQHVTVMANRVDSRFVDPAAKKVWGCEDELSVAGKLSKKKKRLGSRAPCGRRRGSNTSRTKSNNAT